MRKCSTTEHRPSFFCLLSNCMSVGYDKSCFVSYRVILLLTTLSIQIPILYYPVYPVASHVHTAVHVSFPCLLQTPLHSQYFYEV